MRTTTLVAAFALFALAACSSCRNVQVPSGPPLVAQDASDVCAAAYQHAQGCGCPWAAPDRITQGEANCRLDQAAGSATQTSPACLAEAGSCAALEACPGVVGTGCQ